MFEDVIAKIARKEYVGLRPPERRYINAHTVVLLKRIGKHIEEIRINSDGIALVVGRGNNLLWFALVRGRGINSQLH